MNIDYQSLCQQLRSTIKGVDGVISVGVGKAKDKHILVVAVDPEDYVGGIPKEFHGVKVVARKLGLAKFF